MGAGCGGLTRTRKQITPTANAGQKSWVGRFLIPLGLIRVNVIGIICRLTSLLV